MKQNTLENHTCQTNAFASLKPFGVSESELTSLFLIFRIKYKQPS